MGLINPTDMPSKYTYYTVKRHLGAAIGSIEFKELEKK